MPSGARGFWLAALALIAGAASARDFVLESPREGEILRAGELVTIEWTATELPVLASASGTPRPIEEWEVFLSLDGGRTHAIRLTPHLAIERRRFDFLVPSTPTDDARLLLRLGDESIGEAEVDLPVRFSIVGTAVDPAAARAFEVGESPRPGERGVVLWAEGPRDGGAVREVEYRELPVGLSPFSLRAPAAQPPAVRAAGPRLSPRAAAPVAVRHAAAPAIVEPSPPAIAEQVRLRIHRFNQ